jgi:hypothetical protein
MLQQNCYSFKTRAMHTPQVTDLEAILVSSSDQQLEFYSNKEWLL